MTFTGLTLIILLSTFYSEPQFECDEWEEKYKAVIALEPNQNILKDPFTDEQLELIANTEIKYCK